MATAFSIQLVQHIGELATIPLKDNELAKLASAFEATLGVIANLKEIDTTQVDPVHQVTGLENVTRDDKVIEEYMFTQEEALANAAKTYQGYIVVPPVLTQKNT